MGGYVKCVRWALHPCTDNKQALIIEHFRYAPNGKNSECPRASSTPWLLTSSVSCLIVPPPFILLRILIFIVIFSFLFLSCVRAYVWVCLCAYVYVFACVWVHVNVDTGTNMFACT